MDEIDKSATGKLEGAKTNQMLRKRFVWDSSQGHARLFDNCCSRTRIHLYPYHYYTWSRTATDNNTICGSCFLTETRVVCCNHRVVHCDSGWERGTASFLESWEFFGSSVYDWGTFSGISSFEGHTCQDILYWILVEHNLGRGHQQKKYSMAPKKKQQKSIVYSFVARGTTILADYSGKKGGVSKPSSSWNRGPALDLT